jgi:chromosome segregation protein
VLSLDNADRTAPTAYNGDDVIEVTGASNAISARPTASMGRVRTRDVQLLFADASAGAIRQRRRTASGALISARPRPAARSGRSGRHLRAVWRRRPGCVKAAEQDRAP